MKIFNGTIEYLVPFFAEGQIVTSQRRCRDLHDCLIGTDCFRLRVRSTERGFGPNFSQPGWALGRPDIRLELVRGGISGVQSW